jgi:predicted DNA-binding transcriptional regulator AlpA
VRKPINEDQLVSRVVDRVLLALHEDQPTKVQAQAGVGDSEDAVALFTIPEFCRWARISRALLYKLLETGHGPAAFKLGTTVRISRESALRWLAEREAAAGAEARHLESVEE